MGTDAGNIEGLSEAPEGEEVKAGTTYEDFGSEPSAVPICSTCGTRDYFVHREWINREAGKVIADLVCLHCLKPVGYWLEVV